jgi:very-short-patch-repair endonuclease
MDMARRTIVLNAHAPASPLEHVRSGSPADPEIAFSVRVLGARDAVTIRGSRDERIAAIAKRQRGRVSRDQLVAAGITKSVIQTMLRNGSLRRRQRAVFAVGHDAPAEFTAETEALLACPRRAVLSHRSAAALWHLLPPDSRTVDVTLAGTQTPRLPRVQAHRTSTLDMRKDVRTRHGLVVTSAERTLVDIAGDTPEPRLERILDDALQREIARLPRLRDTMTRAGPTRRGARVLKALIADRERGHGLSRSDAELILKRRLRAAGIPEPRLNVSFGHYEPDMVWWEQRVIVEVDSWRWHGDRHKFEADRQRDATLMAQGWTVLRFTARQIEEQPYRVIAQIAAALAHGDARRTP